jgi:large subunit ribosomal protein L29
MKATRISELSALPTAELSGKLDDAYKELFNLRFQRAQGQLTDSNSIKTVRHNIARLKTILRQRSLAAQEKQEKKV